MEFSMSVTIDDDADMAAIAAAFVHGSVRFRQAALGKSVLGADAQMSVMDVHLDAPAVQGVTVFRII